jgi:hypothetical protein
MIIAFRRVMNALVQEVNMDREVKQILRKYKKDRPTPGDVQEAVQNFSDLWCKECPLMATMFDKEPKTLCPPETLATCPIYIRYQEYKTRKEQFLCGTTTQ